MNALPNPDYTALHVVVTPEFGQIYLITVGYT
jgi:hypothetical protein